MTETQPRCVLLADRHLGLTEGVRGLLRSQFDAVVMVADEASLFQTAETLHPAVAVVDLALVRSQNLAWVRRLRERCPRSAVILLSVYDEPSVHRASLAAGANAVVLKRNLSTDLLPVIEAILAAQSHFPS